MAASTGGHDFKLAVAVRVRRQSGFDKPAWIVSKSSIQEAEASAGVASHGSSASVRASGAAQGTRKPMKFSFDHCFSMSTTTQQVYDKLVSEVMHKTLEGYHGTIFAYGQSNSGKTYTMMGTEESPGIIPITLHDIFEVSHKRTEERFLIRVSYIEIYNEEVNDLLNPEARNLKIKEDPDHGPVVDGLTEAVLQGPDEAMELIARGESQRHVGRTNMNEASSRSHSIFRMVIERASAVSASDIESSEEEESDDDSTSSEDLEARAKERQLSAAILRKASASLRQGSDPMAAARAIQEAATQVRRARSDSDKLKDELQTFAKSSAGPVTVAVLSLIDLAGSERANRTGAKGARLKEGAHINQSLLTLSTVISKLSDAASKRVDPGHMPFRNSKLTRMLAPSLGGNVRTAVICTMSPAPVNKEETMNTLRFASRAKKIVNTVKVNEIVDDKAMIKKMEREMRELKKQLAMQQAGDVSPTRDRSGTVMRMEETVKEYDEGQRALEEKFRAIQAVILGGGPPEDIRKIAEAALQLTTASRSGSGSSSGSYRRRPTLSVSGGVGAGVSGKLSFGELRGLDDAAVGAAGGAGGPGGASAGMRGRRMSVATTQALRQLRSLPGHGAEEGGGGASSEEVAALTSRVEAAEEESAAAKAERDEARVALEALREELEAAKLRVEDLEDELETAEMNAEAAEEILAEAAVTQRRELTEARAELTAKYEGIIEAERSKPKIAMSGDVEAGMARIAETEKALQAKAAKIEAMAQVLREKELGLRGVQEVLRSAQADVAAEAERSHENIKAARERFRAEMAREREAHRAELQDMRTLLREEAAKARQLISASLARTVGSPQQSAAAARPRRPDDGVEGAHGAAGDSLASSGEFASLSPVQEGRAEGDHTAVSKGAAGDELHAALQRPVSHSLTKDDVAAFSRALSQAIVHSPVPATLADLDGELRERASAVDRVLAAESLAEGGSASVVCDASFGSPGNGTVISSIAQSESVAGARVDVGGAPSPDGALPTRHRQSIQAWEERMRSAWRAAEPKAAESVVSDTSSAKRRRSTDRGAQSGRDSWLHSKGNRPAASSSIPRGFAVGDAVGVYVPGGKQSAQARDNPARSASDGGSGDLLQRFLPCRVIEVLDFNLYRLRSHGAVLSKPVSASLMVPLDEEAVEFSEETRGLPRKALARVVREWRRASAEAL